MNTNLRYSLLTATPGAAVLAAGLVWSLAQAGTLPDPVATHFGVGAPSPANGWAPLPVLLAGTGILGLLLLALEIWMGSRPGSGDGARRGMHAVMTGSVALIGIVPPIILAPQRGLADAAAATLPAWAMPVAFGVAILVGAVAALVPPPPAAAEPVTARGPAIDIPADGRTVWFGSAAMGAGLAVIAVGAGALAIGSTVLVWLTDGAGLAAPAIAVAITVIVIVAMAAFTSVSVRVDAAGIHWRMPLGWPRGTVRYDDLAGPGSVEVADVEPMAWGGWGLRMRGRDRAIIVRGGEGLRIDLGDRVRVITVDDADTAAAVARGYLGR